MPGLSAVSVQHQHGPQANIWPSCCSRRSRGPGRRWASARLLIHQDQVSNDQGTANWDVDGPTALTGCAALNPRQWSGEAVGPSATSPLGPKAALVMYFELRGVASWLHVGFFLAKTVEKRAKHQPWADGSGVPFSGPRQSDRRAAAPDDPARPSRCRATPASPSTSALAAARGGGLGAFGGDPPQTGCSPQIPPPPRRSYATRSCPAAWFSGRYPQWGS